MTSLDDLARLITDMNTGKARLLEKGDHLLKSRIIAAAQEAGVSVTFVHVNLRDGSVTNEHYPETDRPPKHKVHLTPPHPQVGVSWYEAHAFCQWLAEATGLPIRLPSEAEWERAARHTDARLYPWGQDDPELRCNIDGTGIGSTCAVGLFPDGDAVCGAADMSGNVWEWCRTKWLDNYQNYERQVSDSPEGTDGRVVRGGSWYDVEFNVRCAYRYWHVPYYCSLDGGFRVVCSPSTFDL